MSEPLPPTVADDPATLAALREQAARDAGPFADPRQVRALHGFEHTVPAGWAARILGHPATGQLPWADVLLLAAAADIDAAHLAALREQGRAAQQAAAQREAAERVERAAAQRAAWETLRDALPVPVRVRHNWSIGHYERQVTGADHIVVTADLRAGRLHRRAWTALCQTPSREHDLRALDTDPASDYAEDRIPSCAGCLRIAHHLAGRA